YGGICLVDEKLNGNYNLRPQPLFKCLIESIPNFTTNTFKKLMQSNGGSELLIVEKDKIPKSFHTVSDMGLFSSGIYIVHPKLSNKLIPLTNSIGLVKEMILEEMMTILSYLGAKSIVIQESKENEKKFSSGFRIGKIGAKESSTISGSM